MPPAERVLRCTRIEGVFEPGVRKKPIAPAYDRGWRAMPLAGGAKSPDAPTSSLIVPPRLEPAADRAARQHGIERLRGRRTVTGSPPGGSGEPGTRRGLGVGAGEERGRRR